MAKVCQTEGDCIEALRGVVKGDIALDEATLGRLSRDASLFSVKPAAAIFPKDADDLCRIVRWVQERRAECPSLSLTARSGGTDMTGGPLTESVVLDCSRYMNAFSIDEEKKVAIVEPGVFYRNFEPAAARKHLLMPCYPASKSIAAFGGMVMNNCAGEKTLRYGAMREWAEWMRVVLAGGEGHELRPLNMIELTAKRARRDFEGYVYERMFRLIDGSYDRIRAAAPKTSKNASGYALWRVFDKERGFFDLSQLFVGSQGTLGLLADATLRLTPVKPHHRTVAIFFRSWDDLPAAVNKILPFHPENMEAFDDTTLKLGIRFMPEIAKKVGEPLWRFALRFWPEVVIGVRFMGLPKLIVLVELSEDEQAVADEKASDIAEAARGMGLVARGLGDEADAEKYMTMRRESFHLLRKSVGGKRTAPFIEDFCVRPERLPEFLPKLLALLKENGIRANIAGHAGDGNYHIIPLMDMSDPKERAKILPVLEKFMALVKEHGGTITAEHNDGIMRTPFLGQMFGDDIAALFKEVKDIFDPHNIFNPGKKVGGTKEYLEAHLATTNN